MHGSAFREAVGEWFNSTFLAGVSSIDFIWNIWTYSAHKSSKKGSCYSLQMYWDGGGGQSKLEPQPNRLSSYQSVTKHPSLSPDNIFWKETALWAPLSSSLRCGMNSKSIWNLIQDFYWDSDNQPAFTPLWCSVKCPVGTLPLLLHPWLTNVYRSVVFQGASYQDVSVRIICLLLVLIPIFQFCIAVDWLCAGWLTLTDSLFTVFNWLHHDLPSILSY